MINEIEVIGTVGQEPGFRQIGRTSCVHAFSVGTAREWKNKDGVWQRDTDWVDVVAWNKRWLSQAIRPDDLVRVIGRAQRKFFWCSCGKSHYTYEVIASDVRNLSRTTMEGKGMVDEFYHNPFADNGNGKGES